MTCEEKSLRLASGQACILRSLRESDAQALLDYLKTTYGETPYLLREPDEVTAGIEEERAFIRAACDDPRTAMLLAEVDGQLAGICSLRPVADLRRCRHRCTLGVALYRRFCGMGLGRIMMETLLFLAKELGYEQAELELVEGNVAAMALYTRLGFEVYGKRPNAIRYKDGSIAGELLMVKRL